MADVFLSYARNDFFDSNTKSEIPGNVVRKVKDALEVEGISCWIDTENISVGDLWATVIPPAILDCKVFVFMSSKNSNGSKFTQNEVAIAHEYDKHIIPFRIDATKYNPGIVVHTAGLEYIPYYVDPEKGIEKLALAIKKYLNEVSNKEKKEQEEKERQRRIKEIDNELKLQYEQKLSVENIIDEKQKALLEVEEQRDNILSTIDSLEKNKKALNSRDGQGNNSPSWINLSPSSEDTPTKFSFSDLLKVKGRQRTIVIGFVAVLLLLIIMPFCGWINNHNRLENQRERLERQGERLERQREIISEISEIVSDEQQKICCISVNDSKWHTNGLSREHYCELEKGDTITLYCSMPLYGTTSDSYYSDKYGYIYEYVDFISDDYLETTQVFYFSSRGITMKDNMVSFVCNKSGHYKIHWRYEHDYSFDARGKEISVLLKRVTPPQIMNLCDSCISICDSCINETTRRDRNSLWTDKLAIQDSLNNINISSADTTEAVPLSH